MELKETFGDSTLPPDPLVASSRGFHAGTGVKELLSDLRAGEGLGGLPREAGDFCPDLSLSHVKHRAGVPARQAPFPALSQQGLAARVLRADTELASMLKQVAGTDATVLLLGESGVGKSLVASELHAMSLRAHQPWVEINCAAIPESLIESELFGVERGAFSGAAVSRKGRFEMAHGGTLFLDEVALLSPGAQSKLLRVLQSGECERLGSNTTIRCDLRVIAATNEPLERLVREGKFREDLYYRLNVFPVRIPSLRDRREEIPDLVADIVRRLSDKYRRQIPRCSEQALEALLTHDWPGNIRELENVLERAVILCPQTSEIMLAHLGEVAAKWRTGTAGFPVVATVAGPVPASLTQKTGLAPRSLPATPMPASATASTVLPDDCTSIDEWAELVIESQLGSLAAIKSALLRAALRRSSGNVSLAAASLGLTRGQLTYQLKKISELE